MIIKFEDLKNIRQLHKDKKIIICSGWFDMFHIGHLNYLKKAKEQGDILIVFCRNDSEGKLIKGNDRPIINEIQRVTILDSLKYVDYVILSSNVNYNAEIPNNLTIKDELKWKRYIPIIKELQPNLVITLKESFIGGNMNNWLDNLNIKYKYLDREQGISTTDIINKIKGEDE